MPDQYEESIFPILLSQEGHYCTGIVIESVCIVTQVGIYREIYPEPSGNHSGFALGISFGLRLYFTLYPSSRHNTDTVHSQLLNNIILKF